MVLCREISAPHFKKSQVTEVKMLTQTRSAGQMVQLFSDEPALQERLKTDSDPIAVLKETAKKAEAIVDYRGDIWLYRFAVGVLGAITLTAALGSIILVMYGSKTIPEALVAMGSAAIGALVGLFAPSPSGK